MNIPNRIEYLRLMEPSSIHETIETAKKIVDVAVKLTTDTRYMQYDNYHGSARMLFQMSTLKALSIINMSENVDYTNSIDGLKMSINDPFAMQAVIRSVFESVAAFNHIFISPSNDDERNFYYDLWVLNGLRTQNLFGDTQYIDDEQEIQTLVEEKEKISKEIDEIEVRILNNPIAQSPGIPTDFKKKIRGRIWEFRATIRDNRYVIDKIGYGKMMENAGVKYVFREKAYSHLSIYGHPSKISVNQFDNLFLGHDKTMISMGIETSSILLSFIISDYCRLFPSSKILFQGYPEVSQMLINSYNGGFRGDDYRINDCINHN